MYYITRRALRVDFLKVGGMNGQIVNAAFPLLHLRGGNQRGDDTTQGAASFCTGVGAGNSFWAR